VLQADDVGVLHGTHKLQLPVLVSPILQHLFDGKGLSGLQTLSLHVKMNSAQVASTNVRRSHKEERPHDQAPYLEDDPK